MAPRLSGQTSIFGVVFFVFKSLLGIERQKKHEKFAFLTRKPRNHARILIQWNPVNMDTKGTCHGVRIIQVSVLSGLSKNTSGTHVLSI